ncbi:photosynthetic complex putative assembly protein PuhB [Lichenicoccus sp.]|uniref:photosynthetic complex putative assembly protein PuhB n=1 Tax=Lichenicoccus sp. TaxID=2781899 RepID=UPI003D114954
MSSRIRVVRDGVGQRPYGLPGPLPEGETMLWQGAPDTMALARRAMHVRKIAVYFAILAAWCAGSAWLSNSPKLWWSMVALIVLGAIATGMLTLFAYLVSRTTVYTLTDKRVVLKIGVALSMSINLPFCSIDAASVRLYPDGSGDIPLRLTGLTRMGITLLWPHVRPWSLRQVQPMLRCIPDAARVASLLSRSLAASAGQSVPAAPVAAGGKSPVDAGLRASVGA